MPTCGETSSTLDFPRHATPAAHVPAYFAAAARSSSCIVRLIKPSSISDAADALPSVAMVQIGIHTSYLCISAEVCRQIRVLLLVWRRVRCAGWRGSPLTSAFSYGGQSGTMEGLPISKNRQKKELKVNQSRRTRVYLWASSRRKHVHCALHQWQGP